MSFSEFSLSTELLEAVTNAGYSVPSPVQKAAIPAILSGNDLLVGAKTGTGKTAAFVLPVLQCLLEKAAQTDRKLIRALVLTPTRELAQQVNSSIKKYAKGTGIRSAVVYGGVGIGPQIDQLKQGVDILVATPGRLLDLNRKKALNVRAVEFLIFDEADRMLDMGFRDEIKAVISKLPKRDQQPRQVLLFTATLNDRIFKFSKNLLHKPQIIEVDQRGSTADDVEQIVYNCDPQRKAEIVTYLIKHRNWPQVMIFSQTKQGADKLGDHLEHAGINTGVIHADRSQKQREEALSRFKADELQVLVATDIAARGIDISGLPAVINLEMPFKAEDYVHRIGRTGRAGSKGIAISLLIEEENYLLEAVEALLNDRLAQQWLPGFEPDITREIEVKRSNSKSAQKRRAKKRALGKR